MICAICGHREAVVFMRRSDRGESGETALCEDCARERGLSAGKGRIELRLEDLISGFPSASSITALTCPRCGRGIDELRREGRLGCPKCAEVFRTEIERWMRGRARPPYYIPEPRGQRGGEGEAASPEEAPASSSLHDRELAAAIAAEDYEKAARIRDRLGQGRAATPAFVPASVHQYPVFDADSPTAGESGPAAESAIVLSSAVRLSRNLPDLPFPGPRASPTPERFVPAARPDLCLVRLGGLRDTDRAALAERGLIPRAAAFAGEGVMALSAGSPWLAVFDSEDELRVHARLPGLALSRAAGIAGDAIESFSEGREGFYAFDPEFGWLVSRLNELGTGASMCASLHLPALSMAGLLERVFRGLLARGFAVRGHYGGEEGSAGDLYELSTDRGFGQSLAEMAQGLEEAVGQVARAERRARADIAARRGDDIADRAGRALGTFRYCRFLGEAEAAAGLSALALAADVGIARGGDPRSLALLAGGLGAGRMAVKGFSSSRDRREEEAARARMLRAGTASIVMDAADQGRDRREEGGSGCSGD